MVNSLIELTYSLLVFLVYSLVFFKSCVMLARFFRLMRNNSYYKAMSYSLAILTKLVFAIIVISYVCALYAYPFLRKAIYLNKKMIAFVVQMLNKEYVKITLCKVLTHAMTFVIYGALIFPFMLIVYLTCMAWKYVWQMYLR